MTRLERIEKSGTILPSSRILLSAVFGCFLSFLFLFRGFRGGNRYRAAGRNLAAAYCDSSRAGSDGGNSSICANGNDGRIRAFPSYLLVRGVLRHNNRCQQLGIANLQVQLGVGQDHLLRRYRDGDGAAGCGVCSGYSNRDSSGSHGGGGPISPHSSDGGVRAFPGILFSSFVKVQAAFMPIFAKPITVKVKRICCLNLKLHLKNAVKPKVGYSYCLIHKR